MISLLVEEVFVTEGVPAFTFVRPPNYNRIFVDVRSAGKPVILEGQSGTGKTTCIRQILVDLGDRAATEYLTAREAVDVSRIEAIARERPAGRFVIDDFHRLSAGLQTSLADLAKLSAESSDPFKATKLIIVGINQIGSALIQLVPDIAKRMGIHRIQPGGEPEITQLIRTGASKLNVEIPQLDVIFRETRGDYWLTQQLCQSICLSAGVLETIKEKKSIEFEIDKVRKEVVEQLQSAHYPAVKEFCRGRRFRPSNQPYYKLLRAIGQNGSSNVDLNELANSEPEVRGSINNIKEHRLPTLIESKPLVARSFYYNKETKSFSIDDPALFYFIQHLDWDQLRKDCGFRIVAENFDYEIALSFAGENRELANHIATQLEDLDVPVFYDEMFEANFLGKAWTKVFRDIFAEKSRFVVCLLDVHHLEKIWPTFEREHFAPRVADGSIIPIYLDDTKFVGIPSDIIGFKFKFDPTDENWRSVADEQITMKLVDKLTE
ncbi:TIR domain-containing protein [Mesorhizobium sp. CA13]|uniref:TIR domain-containing protein n=1 Tax=Mesorhizobium sp. CA13 TaxID=2876643 RepID=UPI001CCDC795|nr:TIR domain-containing protein [Mesorhizobium sp. CA13]MBZ9853304.1 TIR domain-containing protein [Mesorhizobium sp. CA13]